MPNFYCGLYFRILFSMVGEPTLTKGEYSSSFSIFDVWLTIFLSVLLTMFEKSRSPTFWPRRLACVCNAQLAIVITNFQSLSLSFGPGGFACVTRGGFAMCSWPLLLPTFGLSLFFFTVFCFCPTSGKLLRLKICFP